jgi:diguanylate cyclase (GGDEF)-like protein
LRLLRPGAPGDGPGAGHRIGGRGRRPLLFALVDGACLVLVAVTAIAQAVVVTTAFQTATLNATIGDDAGLVRTFVNTFVGAADLAPSGPSVERQTVLRDQLATIVARSNIVRAELRGLDGTVFVSDSAGAIGVAVRPDEAFSRALTGTANAALLTGAEASGEAGPAVAAESVLRENLPIQTRDGVTHAVFVIWRDAAPILAQLERTRTDVVLLTLSAALVLSLVLFFVFRAAQARITLQTAQIIEAAQRDAMTGMLAHGALVDRLTKAVEATRAGGGTIAVGLVDIDNFRLVNATYGHAAGDRALLVVAACLQGAIPGGATVGRYGPDEFLIIAPGASAALLAPAIGAVRAELLDWSLRFEESERLPITISAGICEFPTDATSVTDLLTLAATTLGEARTGGGDAVCHASAVEHRARAGGFDVLQGLVLAIDTKDRYTKRHSEDVARYAIFLADRLDLEVELKRTLRIAGLLHDIGKIGIPDQILRKPGRLTADEYEIVKQHVALGDLIVRDLPSVELIRAGIRHHHERWDGGGYLHRLAGEEIPLVARILAIGDAFSAMTTSRPYRKAVSVEEAIRRLEDAAGSQLDEHLVRVFVEGLRTASDAPLPGAPVPPRLWTPDVAAA